jgi:antitoxin CcdA
MINRIKEKTEIETYVCKSVVCDICKKEFGGDEANLYEIQEFTFIHKNCGYGSVFGDEDEIEVDICQNCLKDILGKYIRTI